MLYGFRCFQLFFRRCTLDAFAWKKYKTFSKAPSQGVGSRAENYVPIKIFSQLAPLFLGTTSVLSATRGLPEFENGFLNVFKNFGGDAEIFQDFPWPVMRVHRRT